VFTEQTVNTTITSTTYVDLLTASITITSGGILQIHFSCGTSNNSGTRFNDFRITVDGTTKRAVGTRMAAANDPESASIVLRVTGLSVGVHTVKVQWKTSGGTAQIRPVTVPDEEHASLLVEEVS
jgi:hypothetical protein